jgi:hypothetical protein
MKTRCPLPAFALWALTLSPFAPAQPADSPAVKLEPLFADGGVKRVTLTAKAAERLGIEIAPVAEQAIARKQVVAGLVTPRQERESAPLAAGSFGGFAPTAQATGSAAAGATAPPPGAEAWVQVVLSEAEWARVAKDQPARVLPLATRPGGEVLAQPSGMAPREDAKRSMLRLYYIAQGKDHGLAVNKRMRVELPLAGDDGKRKVVPYGAVYYDATGQPWLYVAQQPLVFERQRIAIERIAGNLAALSEGPPVGALVVIVGAPLLYGAEIFGK